MHPNSVLPKIYSMLIEAIPLINPADMEGNQKLILKIIDCLPKIHKVVLNSILYTY